MRLAGQDIAAFNLFRAQGLVLVHINLTFQQTCPAGGTNTTLARKGQVDTIAQTGVEDVFAVGAQFKGEFAAVCQDADFADLALEFFARAW